MEFYSLIFLLSFGKTIASEKVLTLPMIPESQHPSPDLPIFVYTDWAIKVPHNCFVVSSVLCTMPAFHKWCVCACVCVIHAFIIIVGGFMCAATEVRGQPFPLFLGATHLIFLR